MNHGMNFAYYFRRQPESLESRSQIIDEIIAAMPVLRHVSPKKIFKAWDAYSESMCASCLIVNSDTIRGFKEFLDSE
jgi:hypothetical protein